MHRFKQGRSSLEDDPSIGRPVTTIIDRNIENVRILNNWGWIYSAVTGIYLFGIFWDLLRFFNKSIYVFQ
jgi:hypothetical protein